MASDIGPQRRTLRIIWLAFAAATAIYALLASIMFADALPDRITPLRELDPTMMSVALVFWAAAVLGSRVLPPRELRKVGGMDLDLATAIGPYQTAMICKWACLESIAVIGIVFTVLAAQPAVTYVGSAIALALILQARPRLDEFLAEARRRPAIARAAGRFR